MLPKSHWAPVPALPTPRGSQTAEGPQGYYAGPHSVAPAGVPWWKSHCCSARSFWQDNPCLGLCSWDPSAGLRSAGRDPLLGDSALQLYPHLGPGKTLSTCDPWLCHSICLSPHPSCHAFREDTELLSSPSSCYHFFDFLIPYLMASLYFLPFLSTVPLLKYWISLFQLLLAIFTTLFLPVPLPSHQPVPLSITHRLH